MKPKKFKETEIGMIPEDWEFIEFFKLLSEKTRNGIYKQKGFHGSGVKVINMKELFAYSKIGNQEMKRVRLNDSEMSRFLVQEGDLIFARRSLVAEGSGKCSLIVKHSEPITFESSIILARPNKKEVDSEFLYYFFSSPKGHYVMGTILRQVAVSGITGTDLMKLKVIKPSLPEQRSIAKILSDLDSKIELNQQMNKTLEAIGQAIFKRWFVDFEFPNEKDKLYRSSGGEMVESEFGKIPKGWKVGEVIDEFNLTMGQSPPGNSYNDSGKGVAFFQGRTDFGFRYPTKRIFCTEPARFADAGDTLVSVRAPVGDINMANEKCCIGRGVAAIHHKTGSRSYTYYSMQNLSGNFSNFEAEGTVFGSIGKTDFEQIKIIIPPEKLINLFEKIVFGIDQKIESNSSSIVMLSQIRDSLLPRLMSGKIRVPVEVRT